MPDPTKISLHETTGYLQICTASGEPIVTIHYDGRVEINPAFTVDEAARAFWGAVLLLNPQHQDRPA
jgi:hypothetical protein